MENFIFCEEWHLLWSSFYFDVFWYIFVDFISNGNTTSNKKETR